MDQTSVGEKNLASMNNKNKINKAETGTGKSPFKGLSQKQIIIMLTPSASREKQTYLRVCKAFQINPNADVIAVHDLMIESERELHKT